MLVQRCASSVSFYDQKILKKSPPLKNMSYIYSKNAAIFNSAERRPCSKSFLYRVVSLVQRSVQKVVGWKMRIFQNDFFYFWVF